MLGSKGISGVGQMGPEWMYCNYAAAFVRIDMVVLVHVITINTSLLGFSFVVLFLLLELISST